MIGRRTLIGLLSLGLLTLVLLAVFGLERPDTVAAEDADPVVVARRFYLAHGPAGRLTPDERKAKINEAIALIHPSKDDPNTIDINKIMAGQLMKSGGVYTETVDIKTGQAVKRWYADYSTLSFQTERVQGEVAWVRVDGAFTVIDGDTGQPREGKAAYNNVKLPLRKDTAGRWRIDYSVDPKAFPPPNN